MPRERRLSFGLEAPSPQPSPRRGEGEVTERCRIPYATGSPVAYATGAPWVLNQVSMRCQPSSAANPRGNFPLVGGPPQVTSVVLDTGQVSFTATGLLVGHQYIVQSTFDLALGSWSDVFPFTATQTTQTFPNTITNSSQQFWRILAP